MSINTEKRTLEYTSQQGKKSKCEYLDVKGAPTPLPLDNPPFTLKDIRAAVPNHCFQRNLLRSLYHVAHDLFVIGVLFYAATWIESNYLPSWASYVLWPVYWFVQGVYMTGLWVLAHECGHQAFSDYKLVNDTVGLICHSALLVPYHNWRITHRRHHSNTGSCEHDEVFVPPSKPMSLAEEMMNEAPIVNFLQIVFMLTLGWMPGYLVFNSSGPAKYKGKDANHFSPFAVMFLPKERRGVVLSDITFFAFLGILIWFGATYSFATLTKYYLIPYIMVNYHLVLITYLQHTDTFIPHFRGDEWNWLRGALCTVDRSFGRWLDHVFHHISDTHVCHHLFSQIPFYHAQEATKAIRKVLGEYYLIDKTPIYSALWRSWSVCKFVAEEESVAFYRR